MGSAVGIQTYLGCAEESVYGTAVTPNRFFPIISETLGLEKQFIAPRGMRGGSINARKGSSRAESARSATGNIVSEVATSGWGRIFKHLLGGTPASGGTQNHQLGSQQGMSLTFQKQLRDSAGNTIGTFTYPGSKIISAEFGIEVGRYLEATLNIDARDEVTNIAAAAASYPNSGVFSFQQGTLRLAGVATANVTAANITIAHGLKVDGYYLGSSGLKREPTDNDFPSISGTLSAEFDSLATVYDRYSGNTALALVLEFAGSGTLMRITIPEIRFDGDTPKVGGTDVVLHDAGFTGWANDANTPAAQIEYQDATV